MFSLSGIQKQSNEAFKNKTERMPKTEDCLGANVIKHLQPSFMNKQESLSLTSLSSLV
jgi:hypothetical protein